MESLVPDGPSFSHFADCVILLYNHQVQVILMKPNQ